MKNLRGGARRVAQAWTGRAEQRAARRALITLLPRVSVALTVGACASVLAELVVTLVSTVALGVVVGAVPAAMGQGFDSDAGRRLVGGVVVLAALFAYAQVVAPAEQLMTSALARRVDGHLRLRVMRAVNKPRGIAHLEDPATLDLVRRAQGVGDGLYPPSTAVTATLATLRTRLSTIASALLVARFQWWLALLLLGFGIVVRYRLVDDLLRRTTGAESETEDTRRTDYLRDLALTPAAAKEIRIFGLGHWIAERFVEQWTIAMRQLWAARKGDASPWAWSVPWGALMALAFVVAGRAASRGELSLESLAIVVSASVQAARVYFSENDVRMVYGAMTIPAVLRLEQLEDESDTAVATRGSLAGRPRSSIRLEGLQFTYPGQERPVLDGVDLEIPAGQSLAIVGSNGAGKTTLVKLLAGLYQPTGGRITVDGIDLASVPLAEWQGRVAALFQDFVQYEMPARDNARFGAIHRQWTDAELDAVADKVGAGTVVRSFPKGWDTMLSRRFTDGTDLSGGQWQRLALTRAICAVEAGAGLLVLDEPTANLDVRAEAELFDRFIDLTSNVTTILISHRFSSVRRAERIVVLEHGRVTEQGSHDELMELDGQYARLFRIQSSQFARTE